jgi:hypothetical protein
MGEASKIVSVVLRVWEIICACVVTGIVSPYIHYLHDALFLALEDTQEWAADILSTMLS